MLFVAKLFSEITIKSKPVRKRFVKQLQANLRLLLHSIDETITIERDWDKIEIRLLDADLALSKKVIEVLSHTSGIANFMLVKDYPLNGLHDIYEKTRLAYADKLTDKTFAVRCRRSGQHDFTSIDVERYVGGGLNQHTSAKGVELKQPDVTVLLEVRGDRYYVVESVYAGLGGFPQGTQEEVLSLISGGFDSAVSSYLTIKRGLKTHYCFFNLGGRAHEVAVKQVAYYLWNKFGASHQVKFISVPFEEVVAEIIRNIENSQMGVVLKRMFLRAAAEIADRLSIQALVTGESVAQVSSQTLPNLAVIDAVTDTLVLRPLITADKQDIIDLAVKIGTEEFSKNIPEYCGVISVKPTTRARVDRIEKEEAAFDFSVLEQAIANARVLNINEVALESETDMEIDIREVVDADAVIVDIRHPAEEELAPLLVTNKKITIPFYELGSRFAALDQQYRYFLYCEKGIMSQLQATNLTASGYNNVGVYRPLLD